MRVFDDVWQTIRDRYYDPKFHGVDWEAQRAQFRPFAAEASDSARFYALLRRMIGSLRDAHTRVYAPEEKFDWRQPRFISVGVSVREVGGQAVVVRVERGSGAERAGLRPGDVITSVDGDPALSVVAQRLSEANGSSTVAAARLRAMGTLFEGAPGSAVEVGWTSDEGREQKAMLRRAWHERQTGLRVRRAGEFGVIEFDVFTQRIARDLFRALQTDLRNVRGLVLDLRNNGGGEAEAMVEIASAFLPVGKSVGQFMERGGRVAFEPRTRGAMLFAADIVPRFRHPIIILTGTATSSAAEIFAAAVKGAGRATIIGANTCGCVLAIRRRHILPDGGELEISEMDYRTAGGERLEGAGVTPDEIISVDRNDLRERRDRALDRALELLKLR